MIDSDNPPSYEKRLAGCPIHQWANIDDYLERAQVPPHLWRPFHELALTRGEYPKYMSSDQGREFGQHAVKIIKDFRIKPLDAHKMKDMFEQLISQWVNQGAENN